MIKDRKNYYIGLVAVLLGIFIINACNSKDSLINSENHEVPTVTTSVVSSITQTSARCGGVIASDGGSVITACGVCWSTNTIPTIASNKTTNSTEDTSYTSSISGLAVATSYYIRAYAINAIGTAYGDVISFTTKAPAELVTDVDGYVYETIKIGTQVWMASNLKVTHYRNGDPIPTGEWYSLYAGGYCSYNDDDQNKTTYGRLYNWFTIDDSRNIAPEGWHVASIEEWETLIEYLGGNDLAGGRMKVHGTDYWIRPNTGANNESGFSALPGGRISSGGTSLDLRVGAWFWSSSELGGVSYEALCAGLAFNNSIVILRSKHLYEGLSIRCVKD